MIRRIAQNPIIRGSVLLASGTFVSGALSYAFQVVIAQQLSVETFGDFGALVAILAIASMPFGTFTFLAVRATAERIAQRDDARLHALLRSAMRAVFVCAMVGVMILIAVSGRIMTFFQIVSWPSYALMMAGLVPAALLSVIRGYMQGLRRFVFLATSSIVETGLKLVIAVALLTWGWGIFGATIAMLASPFVMLIVFMPWIQPIIRASSSVRIPWRRAFAEATSPFFVSLALAVFLQVDILTVKHWFSPADAGAYNGIVLLGRVVFFLGGAVTGAFVPIAVAQHVNDPLRVCRSLFEAVGLVILCGVGVLLVEWMVSARLVVFLLGEQFTRVAELLFPYTVIMIAFSVASLLANFLISTRIRGVAWVLGAALVTEVVVLAMFHQSFGMVIGITGAVFGMIVVVLGCLVMRSLHVRAIAMPPDTAVLVSTVP